MIPFRVAFRPGVSLYEQVVYAAKRAVVSGQMRQGDAFPSVRALSTVLISSHDLAEIESFASHVGYLDGGRMQFSEEMGTLADRFREVEITLDAPGLVPSTGWPGNWLRPETSPALVRFIESQFDRERTSAEIARLFPQAGNVSLRAMPLREIFIALAGRKRQAAGKESA